MNEEELLPEKPKPITVERKAHEHMAQAIKLLQTAPKSRHNAIAITNLEIAMMMNNKDRTIKGEFEPNETHTP